METSYHQHNITTSKEFLDQHLIVVPKPAGYLCIADSFCFSINVKPSEDHLQNMFKTFGWVWKDHV